MSEEKYICRDDVVIQGIRTHGNKKKWISGVWDINFKKGEELYSGKKCIISGKDGSDEFKDTEFSIYFGGINKNQKDVYVKIERIGELFVFPSDANLGIVCVVGRVEDCFYLKLYTVTIIFICVIIAIFCWLKKKFWSWVF